MTRTGIKLDLDVGDFISNAGRAKGAISNITEAMNKAEKEGRYDDYGKLAYQKERLQGQSSSIDRDLRTLAVNPRFQTTTANGTTVLKMDSEYATRLKDLNDNLKKLYAKYDEALKNGETVTAQGLFPEIEETQGRLHKTLGEANAQPASKGMQDAMKAIVFGQIANSINDGFKLWANSLDRSGIINAYGSGDILGGRIAEKQRKADIWGGGAQIALGTAGAAATAVGHPEIGIGLVTLGKLIDTLVQAPVKEEKTEAAYAELWQQRSADAMSLAALTGDPKLIRDAFKTAADAAAEFGYSAEEGMDAMKQAAQQGLSKEDARKATEQVFRYERNTGADRGTLSSAANMAARYKAGNILQAGWAGLKASGMDKGQYGEFLRAMQRAMEDGISKGMNRSVDQIAQNLAMMAQIGGGSELWKGENGARRLSEMNAGLESATGLKSTSDILVYRAARQMLGEDASYVDVMKLVEEGLSGDRGTDLFNKTMKLAYQAEGEGREGFIERVRQFFNQNYTNADKIFAEWEKAFKENGKGFKDSAEYKEFLKTKPQEASSKELDAAKTTQEIVNLWAQTGQAYWDKKMPGTLAEELRKALEELDNTGKERSDAILGNEYHPTDANEAVLKGYGDFQSTLGSYFSLGKWWNPFKSSAEKADASAMENIRRTVGNAFYSEDAGEREQAHTFANILKNISPDIRNEWNTNNTINSLANSNGIEQLLSALQKLTEKTDELLQATKENGQVNVEFLN
jgi:hypothetical protein